MDFLLELDNDEKFNLLFILFITIVVLSSVITIELYHIVAIVFVISIVYLKKTSKKMDITETNNDLEYKLEYLGKDTDNFYTDANLINLFYLMKVELYQYNNKAVDNAIKACNNLLRIRKEFGIRLVDTPKAPDLFDNYTEDITLRELDEKPNKIIKNAHSMYELAKEQMKLCMNETQSIIIVLPATEVMHYNHSLFTERLHILLKRNMDIIYNTYKNNRSVTDPVITNYDNTEEFNSGNLYNNVLESSINTSFNFY